MIIIDHYYLIIYNEFWLYMHHLTQIELTWGLDMIILYFFQMR